MELQHYITSHDSPSAITTTVTGRIQQKNRLGADNTAVCCHSLPVCALCSTKFVVIALCRPQQLVGAVCVCVRALNCTAGRCVCYSTDRN